MMKESNLNVFVATWEKEFGVKVVKSLPDNSPYDLHYITMTIFVAFENFFEVDDEKEQKRMFFRFPFKNMNKKARILIDKIDDESNSEKSYFFIVVFLYPDYFSDDHFDPFDNLLNSIATEYQSQRNLSSFKGNFNQIKEIFLLQQKVQDKDYSLDNYEYEEALLDFKKGIQLFSQGKRNQAYFLLRKAHLKFEADKNHKLMMETAFFLGTILAQLNKFDVAINYYGKLNTLSQQMENQKYLENALFMEGFCEFKKENYKRAIEIFRDLEKEELQFINQFNYYFLYGRILRILKLNASAIKVLEQALLISKQVIDEEENIGKKNELKEKQGNLFLELGHVNYSLSIIMLKEAKIEEHEFHYYLDQTIEYYENARDIWVELEKYESLINTFQLIAGVHSSKNEKEKSIHNLRLGLKYAEEINDVFSRFQIFKKIVQQLLSLQRYDLLVKEIDETLSKIVTFAFVDLYTIADFHRVLGKALYELGNTRDALSELLIALNIYKKFDSPVKESLETLTEIINIYKESGEEKYVNYYSQQYTDIDTSLKEKEKEEKRELRVFDNIDEFWIFLNEGLEIFSYDEESIMDPDLFGGFISAIQMFSLELTNKNIQSISIGLDKYSFYREDTKPIYIVGRTRTQVPEENIYLSLEKIYSKFWSQFQESLENFNNQTNIFLEFNEILEELKNNK